MLFKTGENALEQDDVSRSGRKRSWNVRRRDLAFSEVPWGQAAREFMEPISKLEDYHWMSIYAHAAETMGRSEQIMNHEDHFPGGESSETIRPRTRIQIDW